MNFAIYTPVFVWNECSRKRGGSGLLQSKKHTTRTTLKKKETKMHYKNNWVVRFGKAYKGEKYHVAYRDRGFVDWVLSKSPMSPGPFMDFFGYAQFKRNEEAADEESVAEEDIQTLVRDELRAVVEELIPELVRDALKTAAEEVIPELVRDVLKAAAEEPRSVHQMATRSSTRKRKA